MTEDIKEFLDGLLRYAEHLPGDKEIPLEILVLRGHLLAEDELREIVKAKFINPDAYDVQQTKYSTLLRLAKALYGNAIPEWKWEAAREINVIRNSIAHNLKDETIEPRLKRLFKNYKQNDSTFAFSGREALEKLAYCLSNIHMTFLKVRNQGV